MDMDLCLDSSDDIQYFVSNSVVMHVNLAQSLQFLKYVYVFYPTFVYGVSLLFQRVSNEKQFRGVR